MAFQDDMNLAAGESASGGFKDDMGLREPESATKRFLTGNTNVIRDYLEENPLISSGSVAKGLGETALSLISGLGAYGAGAVADIVTSGITNDTEQGKAAAEFVQRTGTWQPQSEMGQTIVGGIGKVLEPFAIPGEEVRKTDLRGGGTPVGAAIRKYITDILTMEAPLRAFGAAAQGVRLARMPEPAPKVSAEAVKPVEMVKADPIAEPARPMEVKPSEPTKPAFIIDEPLDVAPEQPASQAKQPWEMTREEYIANPLPERIEVRMGKSRKNGEYVVTKGAEDTPVFRSANEAEAKSVYEKLNKEETDSVASWKHEMYVKDAIKEGQPVPPEVLREYPSIAPEPVPVDAAKKVGTLDDLMKSWDEREIKNSVYEKNGTIFLSEIRVPNDSRGKGIGTQAMRELAEYADQTGQVIVGTPTTDFGATSVSRLEKFYKQFGFESNKGRYKDYRYRETMIRRPLPDETIPPESGGQSVPASKSPASESSKPEKVILDNGKVAEQGVIPGASVADTFGLTASPGEVGAPAPKGKAQKNVDWTKDIINENPVFNAVENMKKNGGLNKDAMLRDYDADTVAEISKRNPGLVRKEGGFAPDDMAAQLGYEGGDALVSALLDKPTKKQAVKQIRDSFAESPQGQAAAIARRGYTPLKEPVMAGELAKGDALLIDGEKFTVKGEKKGKVILEDGVTKKVDFFDPVEAEGIKRKSKGISDLAAERAEEKSRGSFSLAKKDQAPYPAVTFEKEIEQRFQAAKGKKQETILQRFSGYLEETKNKMTRAYEHLPKTGEFAEAQFALKRLEKQKEVTNQRAIIEKADELAPLNREQYDLFTRKVILDDLIGEAGKGRELPFGFTPETLSHERVKVNASLKDAPEVQASLEKRRANWTRLKQEYTQAMDDIGFDVSDRFTNESYFRHQVLEYAEAKRVMGTGKNLKTPTGRGFLKKREGSKLDINTDYLEAEFEVYAQMMHDIEIARTIKRIDDNYNIAGKVREAARKEGIEDWRQAIPEGYTTWQPREGNVFYQADTIPAKLAEQLYSGALEELGVTAGDLKKATAMGGKRRELVIPQELADTLDNLAKNTQPDFLRDASKNVMKGWKVWQLISPRRWFKYNARNITGDADAAFVGNPAGFSKVPRAVSELYDVYVSKKPMSPEMEAWFDRGGMQANLQAAEISALKDLWTFDRLYKDSRTAADLPRAVWQKYWKAARLSTDFREGILRYANFLDYLEQVKGNPQGKPKNFGASIPEEIMGLKDPVDRAFWLSNDLLGAYDRVSLFGQSMRDHWFPFWSWKEVNMKRYKQFVQNSISEGNLAETVGRKALGAAVKSPLVAARVGGFLIKATAFWSMLQAWNQLVFPEEEKALSDDVKKGPHVIFGRDSHGDIVYFNRLGSLSDILGWFGLDAAPNMVDKWLSGRATLKEIAQEMGEDAAKAPFNVIAQGSVPFAKLALETATRRATFPDVTKPSTIRDRGLYLARSFGLEDEYIAATGKPSKGYLESVPKLVAYTADPLEGAYRDVFELKSEFQKKIGKGAEGFWLTPKGEALYNMRLSLRYGDREAFAKYAMEYAKLGGNEKGILESLKRMEPLSGMSEKERAAFASTIKGTDREKLAKAYQFYATVLLGGKANAER